jgi:hypothetical protein
MCERKREKMLVKSTFYTSCKRMSFQIFLQNKKYYKDKVSFNCIGERSRKNSKEKANRKEKTEIRKQTKKREDLLKNNMLKKSMERLIGFGCSRRLCAARTHF